MTEFGGLKTGLPAVCGQYIQFVNELFPSSYYLAKLRFLIDLVDTIVTQLGQARQAYGNVLQLEEVVPPWCVPRHFDPLGVFEKASLAFEEAATNLKFSLC